MDAVRRRRAWDLGMSRRGLAAVALLAVLPQVVLPVAARAQVGSDRYSSIVVDVASGAVLEQDSADAPRHPASLAKLMTLYLVFEALRDRRISLNELVPVSVHSAEMEPTKLGLTPNTKITVQQAILGLVTKSANDAAAALGEMLGGSEDRFAEMMTLRARAMGMAHTTFMNASGLPDERQVSTARDLAMLGRRLVTDFPDDYRYFSTPSFQFGRQTIFNHDNMLRSYPGADGMKTGYTDASGHNLVTSAVRDGVRLIGVELGAGSNAARDVQMAVLLNQGFDEMGVTVSPKATLVASRAPSLISSAHAASVNEVRPALTRTSAEVAGWSVQAGTYSTERAAQAAAQAAAHAADGGGVRIEHVTAHGTQLWRARVTGLTAARAQGACAALKRTRTSCVVLRPEQGQVASR